MAIKVLDNLVASRIAAGEVIERPSCVLRELLDNSIDAGSSKISVYLVEGGISSITVCDDGSGIEKNDLALACTNHATSKIATLEDIFSLNTLGFRGEALPSIASVSKLTITSNGYQIENNNGSQSEVLQCPFSKGTIVDVKGLFEMIPARKQFLKRPSSELSECRKVFMEKAICFEKTEFLFFSDNELLLHFTPGTKKERILQILKCDNHFETNNFIEMSFEEEPVKLYAIASGPECYKRDRSQIKIFLNRRVIDCFPFVQSITTAFSVALPGGAFPYFYLFIEDSPNLLDFNIHPTKRECKIRNQSSIYAYITRMIREKLLNLKKKEDEEIKENFSQKTFEDISNIAGKEPKKKEPEVCERVPAFDPKWFENAKNILNSKNKTPQNITLQKPDYGYLGQVFNTFLVVEQNDKVLFIDQHAAHERLLYDEICACKDVQELIVPFRFETDISVDDFLSENSVLYQDFGITLVKASQMVWEITSLPAQCRKQEIEIASYIQNSTGDIDAVKKGLFAVIACHSAIKAGDILDRSTALSLLEKVFKLDAMLCPHGRSFVYSISKEELYKAVGRTL